MYRGSCFSSSLVYIIPDFPAYANFCRIFSAKQKPRIFSRAKCIFQAKSFSFSLTSAPARQLSTIFIQSVTGSNFSVPNFEKHCRHRKLHASKIWRLILYFFSNVSFPLFFVVCLLHIQYAKKTANLFAVLLH